jgi:hypothetical protein
VPVAGCARKLRHWFYSPDLGARFNVAATGPHLPCVGDRGRGGFTGYAYEKTRYTRLGTPSKGGAGCVPVASCAGGFDPGSTPRVGARA